jgi:hypothetical protein
MIWRRTGGNHLAAIGGFPRMWLSWSPLDRLIPVTFLGWAWCAFWGAIGLYAAVSSGSLGIFAFFLFLVCPIPWVLWLLDAVIDGNQVRDDIQQFTKEGAILATRCEYLGGHPQLPHGRFVYLLLEGTKQNPVVTVVLPSELARPASAFGQRPPIEAERFTLPILDLTKMKPTKGSDDSPAADVVTAINKGAGQFLRSERLVFVVDYDGAGGRKHKVEFTNFFHGSNEVRNWQNYIVCAQAQADTGVEPHAPWTALKDDPTPSSDVLKTTKEFQHTNGHSGNGHEERKPSSAFVRR